MSTVDKPHHPISKVRATCRSCGGDMIDIWELGALRINAFPESLENCSKVPRVPLTLSRCHPCGLIQLRHTTNPDLLFGATEERPYWYRSGVNEFMVAALKEVVQEARVLVDLGVGDTVVDVGANDGTLLSFYPNGIRRVAFEPARNLHKALSRHAEFAIPDYFPSCGPHLREGSIKILTSVAMFYDLEDPLTFCSEVARLLHPSGVWVNQLAYLPFMLMRKAWDGICHEHLTYWTYCSLTPILAAVGLQVTKVQLLPGVNEGSIRFFITKRQGKVGVKKADLRQLQELGEQEAEAGLGTTNEPYLQLKVEAELVATRLRNTMVGAGLTGEKLDLLGASTKGNTLLQFCKLGPLQVRRAIERSPEKVGRMTVNGIPIVSEEEGRRDPAKFLLVLPWHFRDSIIERERGRWPSGTQLIFPLPEVESYEL